MQIIRRTRTTHTGTRKPALVIAADSVAATRADDNEVLSGWGQHLDPALGGHFDVLNTASDSCTAHWYFRNRLPTVLDRLARHDLFLIGFGVCDQALSRPDLYRTPEEFKAYLRLYVDVIRTHGVVPVLVTQVARHVFGPDGSLRTVAGDYSGFTREVAAERGVALLDLQRMSADLLSQCGPETARGYFRWFDAGEHPRCPDGFIDTLHLNRWGARAVAGLAAQGLRELRLAPGRATVPGAGPTTPYPRPSGTAEARELWRSTSVPAPTLPAPLVEGPAPGAVLGSTPRFRGTAAPGVSRVVFLAGGEVIGSALTGARGHWLWRRPTGWAEGPHELTVVAVSEHQRSPGTSVRFSVRATVPPPEVSAPRQGSLNGPSPVFKGTSAPGTRRISVTCQGRWLGQTEVGEDGTWRFRLPHDWEPGTHTAFFTASGGGGASEPTAHRFDVLNIPADNWLRQDPGPWRHCAPGSDCPHVLRLKPPNAKNILE